MQALFRKYLDNQCTEAEVKMLLSYFEVTENESLLRNLITQSLENEEANEDESQWLPVTDAVFESISKQLNDKKANRPAMVKRIWFRAAAAAILLAGILASFLFINDGQSKEKTAQVVNPVSVPGNNKAVLSLADGTTIKLDDAADGELAVEGSTAIFKPASGKLVYQAGNARPESVLYNSIVVPRGGQYQLTLSDGSKVWLNAASSLRYPVAFSGNERKVELTGEGYFEVTSNSSMPFKVAVENKGEVEVLGTRFNVHAYADEKTVNTTLLEGRVQVRSFASGKTYIMQVGESAQLDESGQITISNTDSSQSIAWTHHSFNFYNADLRFVFRQLSRWYDVDVVYEGPVPYREFTGEIPRDVPLTDVLKLLKRNNVDSRLDGKTLIVQQ